MSYGVNDRFDQAGNNVEVMTSSSAPYNSSQWRSLHIGSSRDFHPGTATKVNRNGHTLNDRAQTGSDPWKDHYSEGLEPFAEKGNRQYPTGHHEFSDQRYLRMKTVESSKEDIFHSNDAEIAAPSFGHSLLSKDGYKGDVIEQVAPGNTNNIGRPDAPPDPIDPSVPTDMIGRKQLSNVFQKSALNIEDLRSMYTLDESIPNFLTLDRTAKQNFMADITDVRKQV